ncbi:MAG: DUF2829 domain-containing protein [Planctomycetes bacterium]|nr:DUF2829 domain-containing protein [Planctomycetota bacterium]
MSESNHLGGIGAALEWMQKSGRVRRKGWNGKGMWLYLVAPASSVNDQFERLNYIEMKTADDKLVPWLASQTDILATDWERV